MKDLKNEIVKTIDIMINKALNNRLDLDISSVVTAIQEDKAKVIVDGNEYWVKNTLNLNVTDGVWLHIPNSRKNMHQMFMMAKR